MGRLMAIEGRKNAQDAKRGKVFTKIIREISTAARLGGGDPKDNPRLRVAVDKGLAEHRVLPVSHTGLIFSGAAATLTAGFLRDGRFPA